MSSESPVLAMFSLLSVLYENRFPLFLQVFLFDRKIHKRVTADKFCIPCLRGCRSLRITRLFSEVY